MRGPLLAALVLTPALAACLGPAPAADAGADFSFLWADGAQEFGCIRSGLVHANETSRLNPVILAAMRNASGVERPPERPAFNGSWAENSTAHRTPPANGTVEEEDAEDCLPEVQSSRFRYSEHPPRDVIFAGTHNRYLTIFPPFFTPFQSWPKGIASHGAWSGLPYQEVELQKVGGGGAEVRYGDLVTIGTRHPTSATVFYLSAKPNGDLTVDATSPGPSEQFRLVDPRSVNSRWEIPVGGYVALETSSRTYVSVGDNSALTAKSRTLTTNAWFVLGFATSGFAPPVPGDARSGSWAVLVGHKDHVIYPWPEHGDSDVGVTDERNPNALAVHRTMAGRAVRCGEWVMLKEGHPPFGSGEGLLTAHSSGRISTGHSTEGAHQTWWVECKSPKRWGMKVEPGDKIGLRNSHFGTYLHINFNYVWHPLTHVSRDGVGNWETWTIKRY